MSQACDRFEFTLNGKPVSVTGIPPSTTLLEYLRSIRHTGSKEGCNEGDCGACTVAIIERNARGEPTFRAVNSCLMLLPMIAGREIVTVEGVSRDELHPVQRCMVDQYGSQCGYCTPGFIVSMLEGYYRPDLNSPWQIADQLCGNLCRCTGYRPIRDAMTDALAHHASSNGDDHFENLLRHADLELAPLDYAARGPSPRRSGFGRAGGDARPPAPDDRLAPLGERPVPLRAGTGEGERGTGNQLFFRPTTLSALLQLYTEHPTAVLVAGATEIAVHINKRFTQYPILISTEAVAELKEIRSTNSHWSIGGAATLTAIEEALNHEFPVLDKMLLVFASRIIRNRATMAGNLVTASPIGDCAPVLLALDASVVLTSATGERTVALDKFFTGYRKTVLQPGEIMRAILIPRQPKGAFGFYKVSKRRELDISAVAAAFRVEIGSDNIVRDARIAFGGVAPTPVRARQTESALIGRRWDEETIQAAGQVLENEFTPITDFRGSADYRRALLPSLLQKFFSGEESLAQDLPLTFTSQVSHSSHPSHSSDPTRALKHDSAIGHVTGGALYVDDEAAQRPMLEIWPVFSPHAHAKILRRDATAARELPGVVAVLMAEDVPGLNDIGVSRHDEPLFADTEAMYHGHIVAVVVGTSRDACRRAAAAVEVDYQPLPAILTIPDAIQQNSFHTDPHFMRRGDFSSAFAQSPQQIEGEFEMGGQEHFYLETHAAWAEAGDADDVFISSSSQHPTEIQTIVAHVLDKPRNKVVVQAPRMGGGFGGKETQGNLWAAIAALATVKTRQPVRARVDRDLDIIITGKRHPFYATFQIGFDDAGKVLAAKIDIVSNGGWSLDLSQPVCDRAMFHLDNCYYLPNVDFSGRVAKTHLASNTAFRGFGGPQGMLVIEEIMARVAGLLGLAPELVRERNLYHGTGETNTTHYGEEIGDNRIQKIWRQLSASSQLAARRESIAQWNRAHDRIKRGIAITPVKFGISFTKSAYNQAGALVLIYQDGTVQVNHGGTEMGQGLYTKILGVACRELGLPPENVRVMKTRTDKVPNTSATAASSGSDLNGAAVKNACETLKARLIPVARKLLSHEMEGAASSAPILAQEISADRAAPSIQEIVFRSGRVWLGDKSVPFAQVCDEAYCDRVSLAATGYYATPNLSFDFETGRGHPFHYYACGAAVTEVEVDGYCGMSRVLRVDILHDVGDSLNPGVDRGQIEGGFVQGMGWLTREELIWDKDGHLSTHSASTYQIPAFSDAPLEFNVELLPNAAQHDTIHGSKAVGEPPLMLAISVREAIRDAIAAFGQNGGSILLASPATNEAIFTAIRNRLQAVAVSVVT